MKKQTPIVFVWSGGVMRPFNRRFLSACNDQFTEGENYILSELDPSRSRESHNFYFAVIAKAWETLPDHMAARFATPEALRKWALIKSGYADQKAVVCDSPAAAERVAAFIAPMDPYALVEVRDAVVLQWTAQSQQVKAMGRKVFEESKARVLVVIADMLQIPVDELKSMGMS